MIIKRIPTRTAAKFHFANLADYITDDQNNELRLGRIRLTNCHAATLPAAIEEIKATQYMNTRAESDKTYHLVISLRPGERPSTEIIDAIEDRVCDSLGYGEHQRISAVHTDTDNLHIHVAINRVHPERLTIHEPYYSYHTMANVCAELEEKYGLERDNHESHQRGAANRAFNMENYAGIESLLGWVRRECLDEIRNASSWNELHHVMRDNGLKMIEQGSGLVLTAEIGTTVKLSSIDRELSKPALEQRLGIYEAAPEFFNDPLLHHQPKRSYQKKPVQMTPEISTLYEQYQNEQKEILTVRTETLLAVRQRKNEAIENIKQVYLQKKKAIETSDNHAVVKKLMYTKAHAAFRVQLDTARNEYNRERKELHRTYRIQPWTEWSRNGEAHVRHIKRNENREAGGQGDRYRSGHIGSASRSNDGTTIGNPALAAQAEQAKNIGRIGAAPPPQSRNSLRAMSELGVVRFAGRSEVLLQGDVSHHLEQQGTQSNQTLRRPVSGLMSTPESMSEFEQTIKPSGQQRLLQRRQQQQQQRQIVDDYIKERESLRKGDNDESPRYTRYTEGSSNLTFAGIEKVSGQHLAMLKQYDVIMVLPVNNETAAQLNKLSIGTPVHVTEQGDIVALSRRRSR